jgi:hypothetical protein
MPNKVELTKLLTKLRGQAPMADFQSRDLPVHPKIMDALYTQANNTNGQLRTAMWSACSKLEAATLDAESIYHSRVGTSDVGSWARLQNWCAGQCGWARFTNPVMQDDIDLCMAKIADWFAAFSGEDRTVLLQRHNFFHGHLILFPDSLYRAGYPELFMLFHAFEYPEDLEWGKAEQSKKLLGTSYRGFRSTEGKYRWRNAIWSWTLGKVWFFNFRDNSHPYRSFLDNPDLSVPNNPCTIGQDQLGVDTGNVWAHLNWFPNEKAGTGAAQTFWCVLQ